MRSKSYYDIFIDFAKALEAHLNATLLPVLQIIDPDYLLPNKKYLGDEKKIMLGNFVAILNSQYRFASFTEMAGKYCTCNKMNAFPENWWDKLRKDITYVQTTHDQLGESVSEIRNDIAHDVVSSERGIALLKTMFAGEKSLFNRCLNIFETAKKVNKSKYYLINEDYMLN